MGRYRIVGHFVAPSRDAQPSRPAGRLARVRLGSLPAVVFILSTAAATAADFTWNGTTGNWSEAARWTPPAAPTSHRDNVLIFGGATYLTTNNLGAFELNQLRFGSTNLDLQNPLLVNGDLLRLVADGTGALPQVQQQNVGAVVISAPIELAAATSFTGGGSGAITLAGGVSGAGGLLHQGGYRLIVTGTAGYAGATSVTGGGVLEIAAGGSLSGTTSITLGAAAVGGVLRLTGGSVDTSGGLIDGGNISRFWADAGTASFAGGLAADEVRIGFVTSAGTVSAATTVSGGAVAIGNGTFNLTLAQRSQPLDGAVSATLNLAGASAVNIQVDQLLAGIVGSGGSGTAHGSLTLSQIGANTVRAGTLLLGDSIGVGNTSVTSSLQLGGSNQLLVDRLTVAGRKSSATIRFAASGGTLSLSGLSGAKTDLLVGDNNVDTGAAGVGTLDLGGGTFNALLGQLVLGQHGQGAGSGRGTLIASAGSVTVDNIVLARPNRSGTSSNPLATSGTLSIRGGTWHVLGSLADGGGTSSLQLDGGTLTVAAGLVVDSLRVGVATAAGGGDATLTVQGGDVRIGSLDAATDLDVARRTVIAPLSAELNLAAASSVVLENLNNLNVGVIVGSGIGATQGTLRLSSAGPNTLRAANILVGDSPGPNNMALVQRLVLGGGVNDLFTDNLTIAYRKSQSIVELPAGGTLNLAGRSTAATNLLLGINDVAGGTGASSLGALDAGAGTFNATLGQLVLGRHSAGAGDGRGTLTMSAGLVTAAEVLLGQPSFAGVSSAPLNTSGTLHLSGGTFTVLGTLADGGGTANVHLAGATLKPAALLASAAGAFNFQFTAGTLTHPDGLDLLNQNVAVQLVGAGPKTIAADAARSVVFEPAASLAGAGSLVKSGAGRFELRGTATLSGGVSVEAGTLAVDGTLDSAAGVAVHVGGALVGSGTILDHVTLNSGSTASPGNSPGSMTVSDGMTWLGGSRQRFEIALATGTAGIDWDYWTLGGPLYVTAGQADPVVVELVSLSLGGGDTPAPLAGFDAAQSYRWPWVAASTVDFSLEPLVQAFRLEAAAFLTTNPAAAGGEFYITQAGPGLFIEYSPVPEPSSGLLALAGAALWGWYVRGSRRPPRSD